MTKKLLFYTHGLVDGGAERLWSCLATAFHNRGYDVLFAQDFEASDNRANLTDGIPLITLGRNHFTATRRLAELLRDERPDVVLSAVGGSNLKLLLAQAIARVPAKTIITYHGFQEWRTGLLSFLTYLGLPILSRRADRTVAVSEGLREALVVRWKAAPEKTITIHNPVFFPKSAPVPTEAALQARDNLLLAVGRFVPEKDFVTLIRAFARLSAQDARLVILGKGPEREKLQAEIVRLKLQDRVSLPGYSVEPWSMYEKAKCFVLSSSSEPFGNVIVEAMAHGLPVVATACSGPQEILQHGRHGRIVSIADEVQLARAISDTLEHPGDPRTRRARADDFSFDVRVPAYEALILDVLGEKAPHVAPSPEAIAPGEERTAA